MISRKSPSVNRISGKLSTLRIGLTIAFATSRIAETPTNPQKLPSKSSPSTSHTATQMAAAVAANLRMNFTRFLLALAEE